MKITITEALVKLKTLESRINKAIRQLDVVGVKIAGNDKIRNGVTTTEDFVAKAKADYQSVRDLIDLRSSIKSQIAESNAKTFVEIGGKKYSITQAIDKKNNIDLEMSVMQEIADGVARTIGEIGAVNRQAEQRANSYVETMLSGDKKNKVEESQQLFDVFYNKNKAEMVDPLSAVELVAKGREELTNFLDEVDTRLVISNSTTFIEV